MPIVPRSPIVASLLNMINVPAMKPHDDEVIRRMQRHIFALDKHIAIYVSMLNPTEPYEPDDRIAAAEEILRLTKERKRVANHLVKIHLEETNRNKQQ